MRVKASRRVRHVTMMGKTHRHKGVQDAQFSKLKSIICELVGLSSSYHTIDLITARAIMEADKPVRSRN